MSTAVHVTPHRGIETATRYIHAAPTVAALFYPVALVAFYSGGRMVHDASTWEAWLSGWIVTLGGAILAHGVPAISFWAIYVLGQELAPSRAQVRARRLAHLAFASPPLFTALGVILNLLHSSSDYIVWALIWIPISLTAVVGADERPVAASGPEPRIEPLWLKIAHGYSALAILLIFLVLHIANHLTAIWSADLHKTVMNVLRTVYRANLVQTALVGLASVPEYRRHRVALEESGCTHRHLRLVADRIWSVFGGIRHLSSDGRLRAWTMGDADRYELGFRDRGAGRFDG